MLYKLPESWKIILSPFFSRSWVLWRRRPGTEWHHRVARFPPRLPQLCQLHVADNHRREEPDPAHLCHAGTGRRLWYRVGLRWSAIAGQLKNEVRSKVSPFYLIFSPAPLCALPLAFSLLSSLYSFPSAARHKKLDTVTAAFLGILISPELKTAPSRRTVSVSFNLSRSSAIWN